MIFAAQLKRGKEKSKKAAYKFKDEFNKSLNTAIVAAFGFLIALVWKDVITEFVNNISANSPFQGQIISAIIVTIIGVLGIMAVSKVFAKKE